MFCRQRGDSAFPHRIANDFIPTKELAQTVFDLGLFALEPAQLEAQVFPFRTLARFHMVMFGSGRENLYRL